MLDFMRRQSFLIYFFFGGIIAIFIFNFGPGASSGCQGVHLNEGYAAKVDGETIRLQDYALAYGRRMHYMRRLAQQKNFEFDDAMAERMGLRQQVLDDIVERKVLSHQAQQWGLEISDEDLIDFLQRQYGVKEVDYDQYESWVMRTFDTTVNRFEENARSELAAMRLARLIARLIRVSHAELYYEYLKEYDRAQIYYSRFAIMDEDSPTPSQESLEKVLTLEESQLRQYFEKKRYHYMTEHEVQARHILMKVPKDAPDSEIQAAKARLVALKQQIDGGQNFGTVAYNASQDENTKMTGGNLGLVKKGDLPSALQDVLFNLNAGEISPEPVRSSEGWHLLLSEQVSYPQEQSYDQVKEHVASDLLKYRAAEQEARKHAQNFLGKLKHPEDMVRLTQSEENFKKATKKKNHAALLATENRQPILYETSWFSHYQTSIPRIGEDSHLHQAIFEADLKSPLLANTFTIGRYVYVVQLKDRDFPKDDNFSKVKEELQEKVLQHKRSYVLKSWLQHLRNQANVHLNPDLLAASS